MARRGYPAEFRRRVVDLVEGGGKVSEVAMEFGVSEQTICVWRRQVRVDAGFEAGVATSELAEFAAAPGPDRSAAPETATAGACGRLAHLMITSMTPQPASGKAALLRVTLS